MNKLKKLGIGDKMIENLKVGDTILEMQSGKMFSTWERFTPHFYTRSVVARVTKTLIILDSGARIRKDYPGCSITLDLSRDQTQEKLEYDRFISAKIKTANTIYRLDKISLESKSRSLDDINEIRKLAEKLESKLIAFQNYEQTTTKGK